MLLVNEKIKFAAKKDAPNPKEVTYWIDLTEDPAGRCWKYFDAESKRWVTFLLGNQEGTLDAYSKAESDEKYATNTALEDLADQLDAKQDKLISEQTIRTINGQSILGSGNIQIDRGLNQNQVQDLINESTKDFITVDETHEYVQDELNRLKLIVLNPDLIPARVKDIIDGEEIDFNAVKDELSEIGYNLLYVDPYNGMYRITYREVNDSILYVHTTEQDGNFIEERKIYSNDNTYEYRKLTHSITIDNRENYDRGIVVSVNDGNIDTSITLVNQGNGGKYLANDGTYKPMGCPNLYTAKDRLPDCLAVLLDDNEIEINRFIEAKEYLTELNEPVYLIYTDVYNESADSRTIEGNQLYSFYYDSVSDSIYIVGSIDPLHQIYNTNNSQPRTTEVTQITNTAQIIRRRISDGIYGDTNGFSIRLEDNKFDSTNNPEGSTISRYINLYTEGNGKDVLFNDGLYRNLQNSIDFSNYLGKDNTTPYTPIGDYHPATKKYVDDEIAGLIDSAPEALDTLNELAAALNDNPNFATDIINLIGTKADQSIIGDVNNLTTTNKTVVGAINEHETLINSNATNISNLTNTVNQHTGQISTINSNISNLTSTVNNQQTTINSHTSSINSINSQITNILNGTSLPIASATQLGAVKIGSGVNVTAQGVISVDTVTWDNISGKPSTFYTLPVATTSTLGGVKSTDNEDTVVYVESAYNQSEEYSNETLEDGKSYYSLMVYSEDDYSITNQTSAIINQAFDTHSFYLPSYLKEGAVDFTGESYNLGDIGYSIRPTISINDNTVYNIQVWKNIEFYELTSHIGGKHFRPNTKIIFKLYQNNLQTITGDLSEYTKYVFLYIPVYELDEQGNSTAEGKCAYLLNPSTNIQYINNTTERYYRLEFTITQECADYINSKKLIASAIKRVKLIFPENVVLQITDGQYTLTHSSGVAVDQSPTICSLNHFLNSTGTWGSATNELNRVAGWSTEAERQKSLIVFVKQQVDTESGRNVSTYTTLRSTHWEIVAPSEPEPVDYYVNVESDGKMKVSIPDLSSQLSVKHLVYTKNASATITEWNTLDSCVLSASSTNTANVTFSLSLPANFNLNKMSNILLYLYISDSTKPSDATLFEINCLKALLTYKYGADDALLSANTGQTVYGAFYNGTLISGYANLTITQSTITGYINVNAQEQISESYSPDTLEDLLVFIQYI